MIDLKTILVVDDSELIHRMYDLVFMRYRHRGASILHAMNGEEAFSKLNEQGGADVIVLDINMPVMSGLEFLEKRRETGQYADVPVVVVSTEGHEEDTVRALRAGAAAYVKKPFQPTDLHSIIEKIKGTAA